MAKVDRRYLEFHGNQWRVVVDVPRKAREVVGATKLKKSLGTDSLKVANGLKWSVVKELKAQIARKVSGTPGDPVLQEALRVRGIYLREDDPGRREEILWDVIKETAMDLRGDPVHQDPHTGDYIYDKSREKKADLFYNVSRGEQTPLASLVSSFHKQVARKEKTKGDDDRALRYLQDWCSENGILPTIEAITRRVAGRFIGDLPSLPGGSGLTFKTANKYISSLSSYWRWLERRGHVQENVWERQSLPKIETPQGDKERPFTDDEVKALLSGNPSNPALADLMRIAALSGARLDAVVDLRVGDCADGLFRFKPQKKETSDRYVPIHSALVSILERRTLGKKPDDDLFPEYPSLPPGSTRPRSDPASKAFGRYRASVGVDESRPGRRRGLVNFHSFRRWFITKAEQAGQDPHIIAAVVGHKRDGMTLGLYSGGPSRAQFQACVEAVKLPH